MMNQIFSPSRPLGQHIQHPNHINESSQLTRRKEINMRIPHTPVKSSSSQRLEVTPIIDRSQFSNNPLSEITPIKISESELSSSTSLTKRKFSSAEKLETVRCCLFEDDSDIEYESEHLSDSDSDDRDDGRVIINLIDDDTKDINSAEKEENKVHAVVNSNSSYDKDELYQLSEEFTTKHNSFNTQYYEYSYGTSMQPLPAIEDSCSSLHTFTTMSSLTMSSFGSGTYMTYISRCEKVITEDSTQFLSLC